MICQICNAECEGNIIVKDANIQEELIVCGSCLNDFGNQEYDKLTKKLDTRNERKK